MFLLIVFESGIEVN